MNYLLGEEVKNMEVPSPMFHYNPILPPAPPSPHIHIDNGCVQRWTMKDVNMAIEKYVYMFIRSKLT